MCVYSGRARAAHIVRTIASGCGLGPHPAQDALSRAAQVCRAPSRARRRRDASSTRHHYSGLWRCARARFGCPHEGARGDPREQPGRLGLAATRAHHFARGSAGRANSCFECERECRLVARHWCAHVGRSCSSSQRRQSAFTERLVRFRDGQSAADARWTAAPSSCRTRSPPRVPRRPTLSRAPRALATPPPPPRRHSRRRPRRSSRRPRPRRPPVSSSRTSTHPFRPPRSPSPLLTRSDASVDAGAGGPALHAAGAFDSSLNAHNATVYDLGSNFKVSRVQHKEFLSLLTVHIG